MARQLHHYWNAEEDRILLELVRAGKSWVFASARLKRGIRQVQDRYRLLIRRPDGSSELGLEAKGK